MRNSAREDSGSEVFDRGIGASLGRLADGVSNLVTRHVQLARIEVAADAKALGAVVARMAVYLPFLIVGYATLCAAAAVALARAMPLDLALSIVGGVNVAGGGLGLWLAARGLKAQKVLAGSLDEMKATTALLERTTHGR